MSFQRLEHLRPVRENVPDFRGRFTYASDSLPPIRAYFHREGFGKAFTDQESCTSVEVTAGDHLKQTLHKNTEHLEDAVFMLASMWGKDGDKMIDLFRYTDVPIDWSKGPKGNKYNPDFLEPLVFRNGVYAPDEKVRTCEDTVIVLGREAEYRREVNNLEDYMLVGPFISGLFIDEGFFKGK